MAGIYGDEYEGPVAIAELLSDLSPREGDVGVGAPTPGGIVAMARRIPRVAAGERPYLLAQRVTA